MKDLNAVERVEVEGYIADFISDRALDGLDCVIIVSGRGFNHTGFRADMATSAVTLLESAFLAARRYKAQQAN